MKKLQRLEKTLQKVITRKYVSENDFLNTKWFPHFKGVTWRSDLLYFEIF